MQSIHALHEFIEEYPEEYQNWYKDSKYIALLSVADEQELKDLASKLDDLDIKFSKFTEPDLDDQWTSIAVEPTEKAARYLSHLPLALKEYGSSSNKNMKAA